MIDDIPTYPSLAHRPSVENEKTRQEAVRSAKKIVEYWKKRGYFVNAIVVEGTFEPVLRSNPWTIHTNLENGLPRNVRVEGGKIAARDTEPVTS